MKKGQIVFTKNSCDKVIKCKFLYQEGCIVFLENPQGIEISRNILSICNTAELAEEI